MNMEAIPMCTDNWSEKLPRGFKYLLERVSRGFVLVRPSNGLVFAMMLLSEMLDARTEQLEHLPQRSYLDKLKVKTKQRGGGGGACLCMDPLLMPSPPLTDPSISDAITTRPLLPLDPMAQECLRQTGSAGSCRQTQTSGSHLNASSPLCSACGKGLDFASTASLKPNAADQGQGHQSIVDGGSSTPKSTQTTQVSKGPCECILWDNNQPSAGQDLGQACGTCGSKLVGGGGGVCTSPALGTRDVASGPGLYREAETQSSVDGILSSKPNPSSRSPSPPRKPSAEPLQILSPMPVENQSSRSSTGQRPKSAAKEAVCSTCGSSRVGSSSVGSRPHSAPSPARRPSPEPYTIHSPMPGAQGGSGGGPVSAPQLYSQPAPEGDVCATCGGGKGVTAFSSAPSHPGPPQYDRPCLCTTSSRPQTPPMMNSGACGICGQGLSLDLSPSPCSFPGTTTQAYCSSQSWQPVAGCAGCGQGTAYTTGQPHYGTQPTFYAGQPNYTGQPSYTAHPSYAGQPNYTAEPTYTNQPGAYSAYITRPGGGSENYPSYSQPTQGGGGSACSTCGKDVTGFSPSPSSPPPRPHQPAATEAPRPSSPSSRKPSPDAYQILSPMPQEMSKPIAEFSSATDPNSSSRSQALKSPSGSSRLPSPEPFVILSPMKLTPGLDAGGSKTDPGTVAGSKPDSRRNTCPAAVGRRRLSSSFRDPTCIHGRRIAPINPKSKPCEMCLASSVEDAAIAELRSESPTNLTLQQQQQQPPCSSCGMRHASSPPQNGVLESNVDYYTTTLGGSSGKDCDSCGGGWSQGKGRGGAKPQSTSLPQHSGCITCRIGSGKKYPMDRASSGVEQSKSKSSGTSSKPTTTPSSNVDCGARLAQEVELSVYEELQKEGGGGGGGGGGRPTSATSFRSGRLPSPEPYIILSPLPRGQERSQGQDKYPRSCEHCRTGTQMCSRSVPPEQLTGSCCVCGKSMQAGAGPQKDNTRPQSPNLRGSPQPFQIISPMPGSSITSSLSQDPCFECRNSQNNNPRPQSPILRGSSQPFEIISPLPGASLDSCFCQNASHAPQRADADERVSSRFNPPGHPTCSGCIKAMGGGSSQSMRPKSPNVSPSQQPFQILSPMPDSSFTSSAQEPCCGYVTSKESGPQRIIPRPQSPNLRGSSQPFEILSPMPDSSSTSSAQKSCCGPQRIIPRPQSPNLRGSSQPFEILSPMPYSSFQNPSQASPNTDTGSCVSSGYLPEKQPSCSGCERTVWGSSTSNRPQSPNGPMPGESSSSTAVEGPAPPRPLLPREVSEDSLLESTSSNRLPSPEPWPILSPLPPH